ncbi:MAG: amino acid:proton antiporter [Actinobacteria bacterium RBG_19FT_COMBO_54_7]|uniref:Amino acid:proton antiporter n=1 Tax=Candidatus Solincola sediminis TaxID=1797199 RepID=A0A1F2WI86_9ACTN|nr:MAG: amino acid:proton antiporter [Candidatus Solincola sediminis]OFW57198.1 MAG: amino acid:proton antiporter [Candidatus Solincola sediminis]OFW66230.1 MAG: amino acid:proton antiporter [Actinobacteria bacterium RBG_19FT_COMBO_54_7]
MADKSNEAGPGGIKYISWTTICFMTVACVASIRNTPSMAIYGWACIFLYLVPAVVFLIPTALVSAELASAWDGGVYRWVSEGVGPKAGFVAIWTQYAMTLTYYPSLLASVASTLAFIISPGLASSGLYTGIIILVFFWGSTLVSFRGLETSAVLSSGGMVIGTLIPGVTLVGLGILYLFGSGQNYSAGTGLLPEFAGIASLVLIVNNFLSYAGMEVNAVHVNQMEKPSKDFPRAMFVASGMAVAIFVLPALAISFVVPRDQLSLTAGVMQAFQQFFEYFHVGFLTPAFALMIVCAMLGGMMGWLAGPSKGLLMVGRENGYLPPKLQKMNKKGIQQNILIGQGIVVSVIALLFAFIPSVSSAFWILSAMTTQIYLIMYVLLFIAVVKLRKSQPERPRGYRVPALMFMAGVGLVSSVLVFFIGLIPPSQFGSNSPALYALLLLGGTLGLGLGVPFLFLWLRKPSWKQEEKPKPSPAEEGGPA